MKICRFSKRKYQPKNNSLKINNFFANQLSPDSQTFFFVPKKLRRSGRTKIEPTHSHSLILEKCSRLGNSEHLIAMYNKAAGSLGIQSSVVETMISEEDIFVLILNNNFPEEEKQDTSSGIGKGWWSCFCQGKTKCKGTSSRSSTSDIGAFDS